MDGVVLIGLLIVGGYILGIVGFLRSGSLSRRVDELEEAVGALRRQMRDQLAAATAKRSAPATAAPATPAAPDARQASVPLALPAERATVEAPGEQQPALTDRAPVPVERPAPQTRAVGLEERLGAHWAVWVGGVALALGAILLVRYSIEQGVFGPGVRVFLGALIALVLTASGEWLRRTDKQLEFGSFPTAHIPGVLTAAGTVAGFGTVYAAYALYGFLGPGPAFLLLSGVGVATMLAASLHGPALAGLGIAASYATPMLVASETPNPWTLVAYLLVVAGAAYALSRAKGWGWLAIAAAAGAVLWGCAMAVLSLDVRIWIAPVMLHALIQTALPVYVLAFAKKARDEAGAPETGTLAVFAALGLLTLLVLVANDGVSPASTLLTALVIGMLAAAGLRNAALAPAVLIAGLLLLGAMIVWPSASGSRLDPLPSGLSWELFSPPAYGALYALLSVAAALSIAWQAGMRIFRPSRLELWSGMTYAAAAALLPLVALVLAYARLTGFETSSLFALIGALLAGIYAWATVQFQGAERASKSSLTGFGTAVFAVSGVAAAALALVFFLDHGTLTVALAMTALATAEISLRKGLPILRPVVSALGLVVLARVVYDPLVMAEGPGATPIFNWLLFGYGVPALCFFAAGRSLSRQGRDDLASRISDALAIIFAALLVFFEIRHLLHDGDILAPTTDHVEQGLMVLTSLAFAFALLKSGLGHESKVFRAASLVFGALSAVPAVIGLAILNNPLFAPEAVASYGPFDSLWLAYLMPAGGAALVARHARGEWPRVLVTAVGMLAVVLLFGFVTLEVRHAYHGASLSIWQPTSEAEIWSYSAAWLALGIALLAYGLWRAMPEARLASAAIVLLSVLKVFLWDMAGMEGAWRAFSFIGLGLVLVGIGLVYQRLVFAPRPEASNLEA
jgi:uncharacterized membrane protein